MRFKNEKIIIIVILIMGWMNLSFAQNKEVDINSLLQETRKEHQRESGEITTILWLPDEFWQASLKLEPSTPAYQKEEFIKVFLPYIIIVVVDGKIGPFGSVEYTPEATIRSNIKLIDKQGNQHGPLSNGSIDTNLQTALAMIKPTFADMFGPMGKNTYFLIFPSKNQEGQEIAVAKSEGFFSIKLFENEYKWELPLNSLIPLKNMFSR